MRKSGAVFAVALIAALAAPAFAKTGTVSGRLIDMLCYSQNQENTGNAHYNKGYVCAQACAREGFPVAILASDGKVYQITGDLAAKSNAKLVAHMAEMVSVTGDINEQDGITTIAASELTVMNK
jgi:hypothetical protein